MAWITTLDLDKRLEETQALFLPIEEGLTEIQAVEFTKLCCQARGVRSKLVEVSSELDQMLQKKKKEHRQIGILGVVLLTVTWVALISDVISELRSGLAIGGMLLGFGYFEIKRAIEINAAKVTYNLLAKDWSALGQVENNIDAFASAWSENDDNAGLRGLILDLDMRLNLLKMVGAGRDVYALDPIWERTWEESLRRL